jgi:transcription initiation factor TFIIIB Brf1 subunit/transcription initiation factor TFIIB
VEEDEGMVVCTKCGMVIQDAGSLRHDENQNGGMSNPVTSFMRCMQLPAHLRDEVYKRREGNEVASDARKACHTAVDQLIEKLCFTRDMRQEVKKYLKDALDGDYYHSSRKKMISVAAVCAYITMIKNGRPVTISEVCLISDCEKQDFAAVYYHYLSRNPDQHPGMQQLDQMIPCALKSVTFDESENFKIFKLTHSLLSLMDQVMLIECRFRTVLIHAAAFIAWKSMNKSRSSCTFKKYRTITRIRDDLNLNRVLLFIKELEDRLISLCASIPWFTHSKIKRSTIAQYVSEILKYKRVIVHSHTKISEVTIKQEPIDEKAVIEPEVDGDREISDSEIDIYIRSPAEVRAVKRLKTACTE